MFRKIDYMSVWVGSVLNSSWNCFSYSDKVCMVLCINFITCFIWCCFWPSSTAAVFLFFDSFCGVSTTVFWGDDFDGGYGSNCRLVGVWDTTELTFFTDSISFFRISISFCNASFLLLSVCFAAGSEVQLVYFFSYYGYVGRLKFSFPRNHLVRFLQDFVCWVYAEDLCCFFFLIQLRMTVCNVRLFFCLHEWFLRFLLSGIDF